MIDLNKAAEAAAAAFPEKDPERLREEVVRLSQAVRAMPVERGDFAFQATYGVHVQKVWFADEDEPDVVEVFLKVASDYDVLESDLT